MEEVCADFLMMAPPAWYLTVSVVVKEMLSLEAISFLCQLQFLRFKLAALAIVGFVCLTL